MVIERKLLSLTVALFPGLLLFLAGTGCKGGGGGGGGAGSPPAAVLSASPRNGSAPLSVGFDGRSSADPDGGSLSYNWDFGNGETSSAPMAAAIYSSTGTYTARLTVTDPQGLSDATEVTIVVQAETAGESTAHRVLYLTNLERRGQGLPPLKGQANLEEAAFGHALDMAMNDYFSHTSEDGRTLGDRLEDAGYLYSSCGENIAAGFPTPAEVVAAWMASDGHRANILDPDFRELGVGYFYEEGDTFPGPYGYEHYWVQDFGLRASVFPAVIENEAYETAIRTVNLYIYGTGWASTMMISEDPNFDGASWQAFAAEVQFDLSLGAGLKRVYVRLRHSSGATQDASDEIVLR